MAEPQPYAQLQMIWPERLLDSPPTPGVPQGYELRCFTEADEPGFLDVMAKAGFKSWDHEQLVKALPSILPGGHLVIVHRATGRLVATAMARHRPTEQHPGGGELAWVAGDPDHRGRGLGMAACAAVTARFIQAGYRRIYLMTDDWRLPALKTYLKLGYEPFLFQDDMVERWRRVYEQLGWLPGALPHAQGPAM